MILLISFGPMVGMSCGLKNNAYIVYSTCKKSTEFQLPWLTFQPLLMLPFKKL